MLSLSLYFYVLVYEQKQMSLFIFILFINVLPHYSDRSKFISFKKKRYLLNSNINIDTYGLYIIIIKNK